MMVWWAEMLLSFMASASYGYMFHVPKRAIIPGGIVGMIGWMLFRTCIISGINESGATLMAAFIVASISGWLARWMKIPTTTISIAGVIPLVPGALAYQTMLAFVDENYQEGLVYAIRTATVAGAIAAGLILSLSLFNIRNEWRSRLGGANSKNHRRT
jgi:uncharacterized membrane protein YjjB (DUF3815 family)